MARICITGFYGWGNVLIKDYEKLQLCLTKTRNAERNTPKNINKEISTNSENMEKNFANHITHKSWKEGEQNDSDLLKKSENKIKSGIGCQLE